jgi:glycine hydroxymethyltransferase
MNNADLKDYDPELFAAMSAELNRQQDELELIASENYTSLRVLQCQGSVLTNKYAEGLPGRRYYGGCEHVDVAENLARDRAKELFGAAYANVQPHSGSQANQAVYMALLEPGDTILSMSLDQGGHLSHGMAKNVSGKLYNIVAYGVDAESETIDMANVRSLAEKHKPKLILAGFSAYSRQLDFAAFAEIANDVGAYLMADIAHIAGLVAAKLHPDPVPHCDVITTTTHKTLRGPRSGLIMGRKKYAKKINSAVFPGLQGGPLMHVIAAKAVAFKEAAEDEFKAYSQQVIDNASTLADGLTAGGLRIVSGGTENHCMLVDLRAKDVSGHEAEGILERVGITLNKNLIPNDPRPPMETSGVRIGTPALTTRGMGETEMNTIAGMIVEALEAREDDAKLDGLRARTREICEAFPIYPELREVTA